MNHLTTVSSPTREAYCSKPTLRLMWKHHFFRERCESWLTDGTEHSLGEEEGRTTSRMQHCTHFQPLFYPSSQPFSTRFQEVLHVQRGNSRTICCKTHCYVTALKSGIGPHCIISTESAVPKAGAWGRPSPAAWRIHRSAPCLELPRRRARCPFPLRSRELLSRQKLPLLCIRLSSRCRCRTCCPRHLQQHNHAKSSEKTKDRLKQFVQ